MQGGDPNLPPPSPDAEVPMGELDMGAPAPDVEGLPPAPDMGRDIGGYMGGLGGAPGMSDPALPPPPTPEVTALDDGEQGGDSKIKEEAYKEVIKALKKLFKEDGQELAVRIIRAKTYPEKARVKAINTLLNRFFNYCIKKSKEAISPKEDYTTPIGAEGAVGGPVLPTPPDSQPNLGQ